MKKLKDRPDGIVVIPSTALQHRSRVNASRPWPKRKLTASMVETAVTNNKVKVFEMKHEDVRRKNIESILSRQEQFRQKLGCCLKRERGKKSDESIISSATERVALFSLLHKEIPDAFACKRRPHVPPREFTPPYGLGTILIGDTMAIIAWIACLGTRIHRLPFGQ